MGCLNSDLTEDVLDDECSRLAWEGRVAWDHIGYLGEMFSPSAQIQTYNSKKWVLEIHGEVLVRVGSGWVWRARTLYFSVQLLFQKNKYFYGQLFLRNVSRGQIPNWKCNSWVQFFPMHYYVWAGDIGGLCRAHGSRGVRVTTVWEKIDNRAAQWQNKINRLD